MNGAPGTRDIEGKATRVGASECGQRTSFKTEKSEEKELRNANCGLRSGDLKMQKGNLNKSIRQRVLVLVDESNVGSSVRTAGRGLDWLKLRDFLSGEDTGRELIEMVIYAGLPPAMSIWQDERDKKNKFMQWLRANGFMVVTKDGSPAEEGRYKANVDVMMAIDALELSVEMQPDVVILVTGDTDFAYLATKLRRRGIRVEVASVSQNLGNILRSAANEVIDLAPLFQTFELIKIQEPAPARPLPPRQNHQRQQHRRRGRSSEVRGQRTEVGGQKSDVGSRGQTGRKSVEGLSR